MTPSLSALGSCSAENSWTRALGRWRCFVSVVSHKRVYAKVRRGWNHVYLGFFFAGTVQEDKVALEVDATLNRHQDAIASVSERCTGAMADFPVIGEFPRDCTQRPKLVKPTPFTEVQRRMLESMAHGEPIQALYKGINTARALVAKGYAEHVQGKPSDEWWLRITDAGWAKLNEGEERVAAE